MNKVHKIAHYAEDNHVIHIKTYESAAIKPVKGFYWLETADQLPLKVVGQSRMLRECY